MDAVVQAGKQQIELTPYRQDNPAASFSRVRLEDHHAGLQNLLVLCNVVLVLVQAACAPTRLPAPSIVVRPAPTLTGMVLSVRPIAAAANRGDVLLAIGRPGLTAGLTDVELIVRLEDGRLVTLTVPPGRPMRPGSPVTLQVDPAGLRLAP